MKVFATRIMPQNGLELLEQEGITVTQWKEKRELTQKELIAHCKDADAVIIAGRTDVTAEFLEACSHLKVVSLYSVGYDHVAIKTATRLGIPVGHTPDVLSKATADTAFLLMQATARKAFYHHRRITEGNWNFFEPLGHLGTDIHAKTLGVFGLGNIGYEMARMCRHAFNMKIIYHNRGHNAKAEKELDAERVSFDELLQQSDVLSVHVNLTSETKGMFNTQALSKMKPNSIFINTARGQVHNEEDLKYALENKMIWGAGLDVTNPEPMDKNNPLLYMENVCVLPHIGSAVKETRDAMMLLATQNVIAGLKGEKLPKCVNPEVYGS